MIAPIAKFSMTLAALKSTFHYAYNLFKLCALMRCLLTFVWLKNADIRHCNLQPKHTCTLLGGFLSKYFINENMDILNF